MPLSQIMPKSGYTLRPLTMNDEGGLVALFSDPEVVKTLAYDTSSRDSASTIAHDWCGSYAIDSTDSEWATRGVGLWAITAEPGSPLVGVRGFEVDAHLPEDSVEAFVVIARGHWGRGLSTESARLLNDYLFDETTNNAIYAFIWPLLNPASEAVQRKMGYRQIARVTVRDTYGEETMANILDFELWRVSQIESRDDNATLKEVGIKLGQLSAEGMFTAEEAAQLILDALPKNFVLNDGNEVEVDQHIRVGVNNPAWATYRLTSEDWKCQKRVAPIE